MLLKHIAQNDLWQYGSKVVKEGVKVANMCNM